MRMRIEHIRLVMQPVSFQLSLVFVFVFFIVLGLCTPGNHYIHTFNSYSMHMHLKSQYTFPSISVKTLHRTVFLYMHCSLMT